MCLCVCTYTSLADSLAPGYSCLRVSSLVCTLHTTITHVSLSHDQKTGTKQSHILLVIGIHAKCLAVPLVTDCNVWKRPETHTYYRHRHWYLQSHRVGLQRILGSIVIREFTGSTPHNAGYNYAVIFIFMNGTHLKDEKKSWYTNEVGYART